MLHKNEQRTALAPTHEAAHEAPREQDSLHCVTDVSAARALSRPLINRSYLGRTACACALAGMLVFAGLPATSANAVTSEELYAEADSIMQRIDALQTDLNQANADYETALAAHDEAQDAMVDAENRIQESEERIDELQEQLSQRASDMYKNGDTTFIDVLLGCSSFTELLTAWDSFDRIAQQNASMVEETQTAKAEAEQARKDYEAERDRASQEMAAAEELATQIEATQASLQQEVDRISAEAAELQAQEEAAAEEARRAAEAAEAARQQAEQQAQQMAQQNASAGSGSSGNAAATTPSAESSGGSSAGSSTSTSSGAFAHPCPSATVSSNFGYRTFDNSFHKGVDFAAAEGTPYYAAESGTVIIAGFSESAGNWIVISHGNGLITKYMHSSAIFVSAGQQVTRGQHIGNVGNTGQSFGAHLHFQVEVNAASWSGTAVDPFQYL